MKEVRAQYQLVVVGTHSAALPPIIAELSGIKLTVADGTITRLVLGGFAFLALLFKENPDNPALSYTVVGAEQVAVSKCAGARRDNGGRGRWFKLGMGRVRVCIASTPLTTTAIVYALTGGPRAAREYRH